MVLSRQPRTQDRGTQRGRTAQAHCVRASQPRAGDWGRDGSLRPGLAGTPPPEGPDEGDLAPPASRPPPDEPVDHRLLGLLRVPARDERVPLVQPLRPALAAALGGPRELPLHVQRQRSSGEAGDPEHPLDDRDCGAAASDLRLRHRLDAGAGSSRCRHLPDDLLSARACAARCRDARLRLHPQSGDRAR